MPSVTYELRMEVWLYPSMAGWHFVTLPKGPGKEIRSMFSDTARGWGSLPVTVTLGKTTWRTSIFPDKKTGSYVLPLKAAVRKAERVAAGDRVTMRVQVGG